MVAVFSTDDVQREMRIPLDHFGMQGATGCEIFDNRNVIRDGADAIITVEPHQSYLFEFERA